MSDTADRPGNGAGNGNGSGELIADRDLHEMLEREKDRARTLAQRVSAAELERARAERERDEARGTVGAEVDRRWEAEAEVLEAQLAQATGHADALERRIEQLNSEGSYAEAAKATREMARAEAAIGRIEQQKQWITETKAAQKRQVEQQARQQAQQPQGQQQVDPLAQYSPKVRAWIEEHPDFMTDAKFRARAMAAHHQAVAEGIENESPEYFEMINANVERGQQQPRRRAPAERLGMDEGADEGSGAAGASGAWSEQSEQPQRRQAPAMPVSRRALDSGGQQRRGEIRLTPDEREHADISMAHVLDPAERYIQYVELRKQLKAQGRMN